MSKENEIWPIRASIGTAHESVNKACVGWRIGLRVSVVERASWSETVRVAMVNGEYSETSDKTPNVSCNQEYVKVEATICSGNCGNTALRCAENRFGVCVNLWRSGSHG